MMDAVNIQRVAALGVVEMAVDVETRGLRRSGDKKAS
jgi:hypothetical protein